MLLNTVVEGLEIGPLFEKIAVSIFPYYSKKVLHYGWKNFNELLADAGHDERVGQMALAKLKETKKLLAPLFAAAKAARYKDVTANSKLLAGLRQARGMLMPFVRENPALGYFDVVLRNMRENLSYAFDYYERAQKLLFRLHSKFYHLSVVIPRNAARDAELRLQLNSKEGKTYAAQVKLSPMYSVEIYSTYYGTGKFNRWVVGTNWKETN